MKVSAVQTSTELFLILLEISFQTSRLLQYKCLAVSTPTEQHDDKAFKYKIGRLSH